MGNTSTPLDGAPVVTVARATGATKTAGLVISWDANAGRFAILNDVAPQEASYTEAVPPVLVSGEGTTTIKAAFKYHVSDQFTTDVGKGTGAGATPEPRQDLQQLRLGR